MRYVTASSVVLMLAACSEYNINSDPNKITDEVEEGEPDIEVMPASVNFGALDVGTGASRAEIITVSNIGTAALNIEDLGLADISAPYEVSAIGSILIPPDGSTTFTVTFTPITAEESNTEVLIASNDPDEATTAVELLGSGVAPIIQLEPTPYDFGTTYIGCELDQPVTISNIGNANLVVTDFDYVSASDDFQFDANEGINGALPWTIAAGESLQVFVDYSPLDNLADEGFVVVTSNDPARAEAQAQQTGSAELFNDNLDVFEQALRSASDILFIVDNSGSMAEEQTNLADNFASFAAYLNFADTDFQVAVITTDNPEFRGEILTPETPDLEDEFIAQALAGINGSGDERAAEMSYQATQAGGDAGPGSDFLRDDAKLSFILVSDEPDSSPQDWSDYLTYFWSLKTDDDLVVVSAIAGDFPSGCSGTASASEKFYYMSAATSGQYLSVCATDWASHLESIAESAKLDISTFDLTELPVPESIEVRVDGIVQTTGWTYNVIDNAVDFDDDHIPSGGSSIEVEYALFGDCSA